MSSRRITDRQSKGERLFSFVVIADTHVNERDDRSRSPFRTNAQANDRARFAFAGIAALSPQPQFVVHLGDIVHPVPSLPEFEDAAARYKEIASLVRVPIHLVPGNHDVGDKSIDWMPADIVCEAYLEKYRATFGADYFARDAGPLRLVVINALLFNSGLAAETAQMQWLDAELEAAGGRVFVFIHYPPYLVHETEGSTYDNIDQPGRAWLVQRFKHAKIEAVFAGHVHNFWYDVIGRAEMYMLPSTAFLRHDFTELYRVAPGDEYGRGDTEKFGYFIVDVYEEGHIARLVRTHGGTLAAGSVLPDVSRVGPVHTKRSPLRRFGVELRHPWAEIVQIPSTGGVQEFGRKPARNDYQVMALWEMGVRTLKIPTQDIVDEATLRRAELLAAVGHDFILTSLGVPKAAVTDKLVASALGPGAIEVNLSVAKALEQGDALVALRARTGARVLLAHLRTSEDSHFDGKHFSHFVNTGLRPDELARNSASIARLLAEKAIDGITVRVEWGSDIVAVAEQLDAFSLKHGCDILASMKLATHSLAVANDDDVAIATLVAQTLVMSCCSRRVHYVFDTFMDVDRGYFPRNGFVDRRFNPRLASRVVASLCAALNGSESAEFVRMERFDGGRSIEFRRGSSSFLLVCGGSGETALRLRSHGATHPFAIDLATGEIGGHAGGLTLATQHDPRGGA